MQKILIVDDKPENLYACEKILGEVDAEIIKATDGNEALKACLHNDFALAILDVQMPKMDGYELAEFMRNDDKTRHLPIIFLSAVCTDESHIFKGYESGAVDFIIKPFNPKLLLSKVNVFLSLDQQKKRLEELVEKIEKTNNQLIKEMADRKRAEAELLRSQKLESIGLLAGGVAHDFNNILTIILGNISLAHMLADRKDILFKRLDEAEKACLRAKDLTQQLLTFSRGGAPVVRTASVAKLLEDSTGFALSGSNILCEFSIPQDLWPADIDEGQINQVINNLVINAVHAIPEGGKIEVRAENVTLGADRTKQNLPLQGDKYVKISIKDHGVGIPEGSIHKIFDPYYTTKKKGSGLGLAISYSIIKKHLGYITAESELGLGTTFHIFLPASEKQVPAELKAAEAHLGGNQRVLIMDDEEMVRDVAGTMLEHIGYVVEFARNGAEAIASYKQAKESHAPFATVILDLTIPGGMGGKETIKKLIEFDPEAKVIVSSGYSTDPVMSKYAEYGFKGVVPKPYIIEQLRETLYKVIMGTE
ncbi:MAG: response regulator [Desulfobulbaceae bacterium]|nr:response regulator [Desulfobulbaceae bacterium]